MSMWLYQINQQRWAPGHNAVGVGALVSPTRGWGAQQPNRRRAHNNRLKLTARGKPTADARLRMRAAA